MSTLLAHSVDKQWQLEEMAQDARASAGREAERVKGATAREKAWAALPPELTAPGRYHESVTSAASPHQVRGDPSGDVSVAVRPMNMRLRPRSSSAAPS
jgi:hypothetical protein